jgi:GNAT superfamily N-acetyltransferase
MGTVRMNVERARPEELGAVLAVLTESARWLRARGIQQWPDPFPPDRVEPSIARGETYLVRVGGEVAGTITLRWADPAFWGEQPPVAGYVHAIAVRREFAGLGPKLLDWAEQRVRKAGSELLRLDCLSENAALRAYYELHGFVHCGDTTVDDFRTSLYERLCT